MSRHLENFQSRSGEVLFHVGAHKTASTFLQSCLRADDAAIADSGVTVVQRARIKDGPLGEALRLLHKGRQPDSALSNLAASTLHELLDTQGRRVLITSEDILGRLSGFYASTGPVAEFLVRALPGLRVRFLLYTRNQADYLESAYVQYIHAGKSLEFSRFLEKFDLARLSWVSILDRLAAVVGADAVKAVPYESIRRLGSPGFYREFLSCCGLEALAAKVGEVLPENSRSANRSYSAVAVEIAKAANAMLGEEDKRILRRFLQENFSTATHSRAILFEPEQRACLMAAQRADNQLLFDGWLSAYPEEAGFYRS